MPHQYPGRIAWEVQAGGRSEDLGMVNRLFDVSGEEDRKAKKLEAENKELRAKLEHFQNQNGAQGEEARLPTRKLRMRSRVEKVG